MTIEQMFIAATRKKLRFVTNLGQLSVEDVWDLSLEQLDELAKGLRRKVNDAEESFINEVKTDVALEISFEIVKYVIGVKMEEKAARLQAKKNAARQQQILQILESKKNEALQGKSIEELEQELLELSQAAAA